MAEKVVSFFKWLGEELSPISDFFWSNRHNVFLWIGLLLLGLLIFKLTYDALTRGREQ
ncbi:MAG: hypothetical protein PHD02_03560 [Bacilli bacterium]|nr:hypothetical protein [Bacilli bacterium]